MTEIPLVRRAAIALVSLSAASLLFHANFASAMVTRGDDLARAGEGERAIVLYRRAIAFDGASAVAADRLAFALVMRGAPGDALEAYEVTGRLLRARPADAALLADRGFAAERLRRWRAAERTFAAAARIAHDPRYAHLAARMAQRSHDAAAVRRHLLDALALDAGYAPARAALRRFRG
jgi:tetratricopeptide (TPR) repeat protein